MSRVRMEWELISGYPVFVYTTFIDNNKFKVKIVIGEKGNQNAEGYGPNAKADIEYIQNKVSAKGMVTSIAFKRAKKFLKDRRKQCAKNQQQEVSVKDLQSSIN